MKWLYTIALPLLLLINSALANDKPYQQFGDYKVFATVFNSTFITPEIAKSYKLVRAKDRVYINVAVVKEGTFGLPAKVEGKATNLMQQSNTLEFMEIKEPDATYYLAPLFHLNEEIIHFTIDVTPEGETEAHTVTFTKKLYND